MAGITPLYNAYNYETIVVLTPFVNWAKQRKRRSPFFPLVWVTDSLVWVWVTDSLGCLYKNGDMVTPTQGIVVCFVLM